MNPPSWDCSYSHVSFSISCLQPGYRPCLRYNHRSFHCLNNRLKTLYHICGVKSLWAMQTLAKLTSLGI